MKYKLAPSILAADFSNLGRDIKSIDEAGAEWVHIDVMDGLFVPSISFGMPVISSIRTVTNRFFDVHLMIEEPVRYVEEFKNAGADLITVHYEACENLETTIHKIKELGIKASVSIKPETSVSVLESIIDQLDMVLIMSVNPGFGGQAFMPIALDKIRELKSMVSKKGLDMDIQVDGGINLMNVKDVLLAGANVIVAGTSVFKGEIESNVRAFKEAFGECC